MQDPASVGPHIINDRCLPRDQVPLHTGLMPNDVAHLLPELPSVPARSLQEWAGAMVAGCTGPRVHASDRAEKVQRALKPTGTLTR